MNKTHWDVIVDGNRRTTVIAQSKEEALDTAQAREFAYGYHPFNITIRRSSKKCQTEGNKCHWTTKATCVGNE